MLLGLTNFPYYKSPVVPFFCRALDRKEVLALPTSLLSPVNNSQFSMPVTLAWDSPSPIVSRGGNIPVDSPHSLLCLELTSQLSFVHQYAAGRRISLRQISDRGRDSPRWLIPKDRGSFRVQGPWSFSGPGGTESWEVSGVDGGDVGGLARRLVRPVHGPRRGFCYRPFHCLKLGRRNRACRDDQNPVVRNARGIRSPTPASSGASEPDGTYRCLFPFV